MTYVPSWLSQPSTAYAIEVAKDIGFATVVLLDSAAPVISHVPVYVAHDEDSNTAEIRFHVASGNTFATRLMSDSQVVAIFRGGDGYISSRWYDHENVPTWNYAAIHMQGTVAPLSEFALREHVLELVENFDPGLKIRGEYVDQYLPWIRGFSMQNPEIEPVFKLSQDKNSASFAGAVAGLRARGRWLDNDLAASMISLVQHLDDQEGKGG